MLQRTYVSLKLKKRPKSSAPFVKATQEWRETNLKKRIIKFAENNKKYVEECSTKRMSPWDSRFPPFDRDPRDGVYFLMKQLMDDKLNACNYHQKPVQKLFSNLGLMGPKFGWFGPVTARWKPRKYARLPAETKWAADRNNLKGWSF
ncbi:hypothetical protein XU18_0471 [Perkinsela sp. CCAP 1560/4]|nr:hypothetical protein XU18_0471 [Perkinsela sp. CCAP 1560/4]|eukprot:KNH09786.1 hypothetical protein XU18_0471 [Perkinsela sp. CCAP 1560/4]